MANPTQKNSLILTVPLFSKSDKKWRKCRKICYFGIGVRDKTIRYSATIHEKIPPVGSQIGKSARQVLRIGLCSTT